MKYFNSLIVAFAFLLSSCQAPIRPNDAPGYFKSADQALTHMVSSLAEKIAKNKSPNNKLIPVDSLFNETSAEVASMGKIYQQQFADKLEQSSVGLKFSSLNRQNITTAQWIVLLSYAPISNKSGEHTGNWIRLKAAIADIVTGEHLAATEAYLVANQFESDPTKFYKEAPMYLTDQHHKDRVQAVHGKAGPLKQRLVVQAAFADAVVDYDVGNYTAAEVGFRDVLQQAPDHQGALTGVYQSLWRQGKKVAAETAFGQLMSASIDAGNIAVKILFKVGSIDFVEITDLSDQYRLWLKAIGQTMHNKSRCIDVTGHASRSGSSEFNDRLSLQRANRIAGLMQQSTPGIASMLKAYGKGFQQPLVGTGTNDATDAIDRRVEFTPRAC